MMTIVIMMDDDKYGDDDDDDNDDDDDDDNDDCLIDSPHVYSSGTSMLCSNLRVIQHVMHMTHSS